MSYQVPALPLLNSYLVPRGGVGGELNWVGEWGGRERERRERERERERESCRSNNREGAGMWFF